MTYIDVVFDGPPSHESGRFVEVENADGASIRVGEWIDRGNGLWALRIAQEEICGAVAEGAQQWPCQLGVGHQGPFHMHADKTYGLQWANGEDGYVPDECPDPAAHEEYFS